jgi:diguanylate cyclase (GGDEF)-like protein
MCLSLHDTSATLSQEVSRLFGDKNITIILYLFHSKTGELGISASQKGQMQINIKDKRGDMFDQWMVKTMQPLRVEDTKRDFRFDLEKLEVESEDRRKIRSLISVPLTIGNKALGILRVDSPKAGQFAMEDLRFLRTIGDLGAIAIENAQLYEKVEDLAIRDGLTGLYLKHFLMDRLAEEINRELKRGEELAFIMLDLDDFKKYNDKHGHTAGDIVLKTVARVLKGRFKAPGNVLARYGGEEFCVLLPGCSKDKAVALAEEFRKQVAATEILLRREKTQVTVSIGVASFPGDAQMREELIQKADHALYKAKQKGRNQVCAA